MHRRSRLNNGYNSRFIDCLHIAVGHKWHYSQ